MIKLQQMIVIIQNLMIKLQLRQLIIRRLLY